VNPPLRVDAVGLDPDRVVNVVRDDLMPGGTKARVLPAILEAMPNDEFVYGGPAQGYAQVALAIACRKIGRQATCFVAKRKQLHPLTREAHLNGAQVVQVPYGRLSVVQHRARNYAAANAAGYLPLGFGIPEFHDALYRLALQVPVAEPSEVWCVAGSGALSRALQRAWPTASHHALRIGAPPSIDNARLWTAPEAFDDAADDPPPFPSCANYDAKLWRFVKAHATDGALVWNVAA
jgi:hypothetical protein